MLIHNQLRHHKNMQYHSHTVEVAGPSPVPPTLITPCKQTTYEGFFVAKILHTLQFTYYFTYCSAVD